MTQVQGLSAAGDSRTATSLPEAPAGGGFPQGFLWGAATSAYQVEGSPLADGAGPSIWHRFTHTPGRVLTGETGDVACDHYRRTAEDLALMREIGLTAYRFSVSWSRILPEGSGAVNSRGLDHYDAWVDQLLGAGITPMLTLYHWDLPAALDDRGGWRNPDVAQWFADYATVLYRRLADRVPLWATLNEPWVVVDAGYVHGVHAPGQRCPFAAARAALNLLRAHGAAVQAGRAAGCHALGLVVNLEPKYPASQGEEDRAAARRADAYWNRQFLDPVLLGQIPEELPALYGEAWPPWTPAELELIRTPVDFIGVNYYTRGVVRHDPTAFPDRAARVKVEGALYTEMDWEVFPAGLEEVLVWLSQRYGRPALYITENGAAFADPPPTPAGVVEDPQRVEFLRQHLRAARSAIARGVDLRGYFVWSLLDNFEWSLGTSRRFGLVHVDFSNQRRTLKTSATYYRQIILSNGAALDGE